MANWVLPIWVLFTCQALAKAGHNPTRFILVTSPGDRNVYYAKLPSFHELTKPVSNRSQIDAQKLIDGAASKCEGAFCTEVSNQGLSSPQGLALYQDSTSAWVYVSDVEAENIYKYSLSMRYDEPTNAFYLLVGDQERVSSGIPGGALWLSVDGLGNLFYTSGTNGQIEMISSENLKKNNVSESAREVLYKAADSTSVSQPGGIVADNFFVYWANRDAGETAGTIVKAYERKKAESADYPKALTSNAAMASGVCLARDTVFYTADTESIFAVKQQGGAIAEVTSGFQKPRGCVYDNVGTLYVADEQANAIYSLPGNMPNLRAVKHITKVISVNQPQQLVIYSGAVHLSLHVCVSMILAAGLLASLKI